MASIQNPVQAVPSEAAAPHQEREHEGQRGGVRHAGGASACERADAVGVGPGRAAVGSGRVALALGLAACQRGHRVRFTTTAALVSELIEARDEKKLLRFQKQIASYELLIVDELGFVPLSKTGAELLFEMLSQRYDRRSAEH